MGLVDSNEMVSIGGLGGIGVYETLYNNDGEFMMLKLETEINWTTQPHIRPICLPSAETYNNLTGRMATLTAFTGRVEEVELKIVSNDLCDRALVTEICAGAEVNKKGPCEGEVGNSLVTEVSPGNYELVGMVKKTIKCGGTVKNKYIPYKKINEFVLEWINENKEDGRVDGQWCPSSTTGTEGGLTSRAFSISSVDFSFTVLTLAMVFFITF